MPFTLPDQLLALYIQNTTVTVTLVFIYSLIRSRIELLKPSTRTLVTGFYFGMVASVNLLSPVQVAPGVVLDLRQVVILTVAALEGRSVTAIMMILVFFTRVVVGLPVISLAAVYMILAALVGLYFHRFALKTPPFFPFQQLLAEGVILTIATYIVAIVNFNRLPISLLPYLALYVSIVHTFGPLVLGTLLIREKIRTHNYERYSVGDAALRASQEGVIVADYGGRIIYSNPAAERLFSLRAQRKTEEETPPILPGTRFFDYFLEPGRSVLMALLDDKRLINPAVEVIGRRSDETVFPVSLSASPLQNGTVFNLHDLSEAQAAAREATQAQIEREKVRTIRNLISDLSHDLKTPVQGVKFSTYMITQMTERAINEQERGGTAIMGMLQKAREHSQILDQGVQRLQALVDALVEMGRLDAMPQFHFMPINLNTLITEVIQTRSPLADEKQIEIHSSLCTSSAVVEVDQREFQRVLENLIDNALQYTPEGKHIYVNAECLTESAIIAVRDEGIGIAPEVLPQIFDRFYRADPARSARDGGMGLGLSIVKRIVQGHGGSINVESTPNVGTTFIVSIPLTQHVSELLDSTT